MPSYVNKGRVGPMTVQAAILRALQGGRVVLRKDVLEAVYGSCGDKAPAGEQNCFAVELYNLRRKGFTIESGRYLRLVPR